MQHIYFSKLILCSIICNGYCVNKSILDDDEDDDVDDDDDDDVQNDDGDNEFPRPFGLLHLSSL